MDHTFVDAKSLKNLEDYAVFLTTGILTLNTLHNIEVRAIEIGIMKDDQAERANTMIWDLRRLMQLYKAQTESILEITGDFDATSIIVKLKEAHLKKSRARKLKPISPNNDQKGTL